ncbi:rhodanese-like domain-containing protein [Myceligenerans indicum]|uniref:Rhodanese-like domain-containing protein n=1 Tax=Myceligenerans indicum TaxID=2593663 RepID=A0ABS1LIK6_9MICO|nr:rhodanese-like domain-containing protein [Myceligenerans indicum]MBL0885958.1 rhodanese-like domain-containing protein [Myceligenerans indicum]
MAEVSIDEFAAARADGAFVVDVREPSEYVQGHVPGAELVPLGELARLVRTFPGSGPVYAICASGNRSLRATEHLRAAGVEAYSVRGGTTAWIGTGRPVVTGPHVNA